MTDISQHCRPDERDEIGGAGSGNGSATAAAVRPGLRPAPLPTWAWALLLLALTALSVAVGTVQGYGALGGGLIGPDSYAHGARALDLIRSGAWFDPTMVRVNPPEGLLTHWTRPIDGLTVLLALPALPFAEPQTAVLWAATLLPGILLALMVAAAWWAVLPWVSSRAALAPLCVAILLQPVLSAQFVAGMLDHHGPAFIGLALTLGAISRLAGPPPGSLAERRQRRTAFLIGAGLILAVWANGEVMIFVGGLVAAMGVFWLLGSRTVAANGTWMGLGMASTGLLCTLAERGPAGLAEGLNELDRISLFHVSLFSAMTVFWAAARALESVLGERLRPASVRSAVLRTVLALCLAAAGAAACALIVAALQPQLLAGQTNVVDPTYAATRLGFIREGQGIVTPGSGLTAGLREAAVKIPFILAGGLAAAVLASRAIALPMLVLTGIQALLLMGLTHFHLSYRFAGYFAVLAAVPLTVALWRAMTAAHGRAAAGGRTAVWSVLLLVLVLLAPLLGRDAKSGPDGREATRVDMRALVGEIAKLPPRGEPSLVMAFADLGPEILFRTQHAVLSVPNHRRQQGYIDTHAAMKATDDEAARNIVQGRGVGYLVYMGSRDLAAFNGLRAEGDTLGKRLSRGETPGWLEEVDLPAGIGPARLFRVTPMAGEFSAGQGDRASQPAEGKPAVGTTAAGPDPDIRTDGSLPHGGAP